MDAKALIGKALESVLIFPSSPVHPAWINELTTPIATWAAFLKLSEVGLVQVEVCEVKLCGDKYPSLGLALEACAQEALRSIQPNHQVLMAQPLEELCASLPALISGIEESDPLGEGAISQYTLRLGNGVSVIFRHIMPPTTLGVCIES